MFTGYTLLGMSIILTIAGIAMSFFRKERERMQKRVMTELPERSASLGSPEALKAAQHRGYITLAAGIILFFIWLSFLVLKR
jgi:hypothetical protein